ncbi:MAG: histidine phosphatase family protein [Desulfobacteraceae bacterium]|jgi:broad specificity phosphatase PhoE
MSEICFARHAQASFGKENYDRLSSLGMRQAEILADYLVRIGLDFHAVYSGSMERQIATARKVLSAMGNQKDRPDLRIVPELNEYDSRLVIRSYVPDLIREDPAVSDAVAQMYTDRRSFQMVFERAVLRWISGRNDMEGVETWKAFKARVHKGVKMIMEENGRKKRILVFSSGGAISTVMQMALSLTDEETIRLSWQIQNTSLSVFKYSGKDFSLSSFNSLAHLELLGDAALLTYR